jgi:hypothetical protein
VIPDDTEPDEPEPVPARVRLVGGVWAAYGVAALLIVATAVAVMVGMLTIGEVRGWFLIACPGTVLLAVLGGGLAVSGFRCTAGTVESLEGSAYLTVMIGSTLLLFGAGALLLEATLPARTLGVAGIIVVGFLAVAGGMLTGAGVLAFLARGEYGDWRKANQR